MEKEKKGIRCSYAVLVIILFAALAFVTDYAIIERKTRTCDCPKAVELNYSYKNVSGFYSYLLEADGELEESGIDGIGYYLYLYEDGTFAYIVSAGAPGGTIGNYVIEGDKIKLNSNFAVSSDVSLTVSNDVKELTIGGEDTIVDSTRETSISLTRGTSDVENQYKHYINQYFNS